MLAVKEELAYFKLLNLDLIAVSSYLPLSIVKYDVSEHCAGSQVSDHYPLGYLFLIFKIRKYCIFVQLIVFVYSRFIWRSQKILLYCSK